MSHEPGPGPGKVEWVTDAIEMKVNAVCARCNDGWMHDLDHDAEELFLTHAALGYSVKVASMAEKATLARWSALIAVLFDQTSSKPRIPRRHHQALLEGEIPEDMQVWLFRTAPPDDRDVVWAAHRYLTLVGHMRSGITRNLDVYFMTFGIKQLVFHVALPTEDMPSEVKLRRRSASGGIVRQICPLPLTPLIWPPPQSLPWEDALGLPDQIFKDTGNPKPSH